MEESRCPKCGKPGKLTIERVRVKGHTYYYITYVHYEGGRKRRCRLQRVEGPSERAKQAKLPEWEHTQQAKPAKPEAGQTFTKPLEALDAQQAKLHAREPEWQAKPDKLPARERAWPDKLVKAGQTLPIPAKPEPDKLPEREVKPDKPTLGVQLALEDVLEALNHIYREALRKAREEGDASLLSDYLLWLERKLLPFVARTYEELQEKVQG